jgi:hypothetical protein
MHCAYCNKLLPAAGFGRPRKWCDERCANAAAREAAELGRAVEVIAAHGLAVVGKSMVEDR